MKKKKRGRRKIKGGERFLGIRQWVVLFLALSFPTLQKLIPSQFSSSGVLSFSLSLSLVVIRPLDCGGESLKYEVQFRKWPGEAMKCHVFICKLPKIDIISGQMHWTKLVFEMDCNASLCHKLGCTMNESPPSILVALL